MISVQSKTIHRIGDRNNQQMEDYLAVEEPLEIKLVWGPANQQQERSISITMRTPGQDEELALGFLYTEGIIQSDVQLESVTVQPLQQSVRVTLSEMAEPQVDRLERNFYMTSSCGVCGKTSIDAVFSHDLPALSAGHPVVSAHQIRQLPEQLRAAQPVFKQTGGLHAAALFHPDGTLQLLREDIGRHNAVDKLIGAALRQQQLPLSDSVLLLSGRAGFELVQKSVLAGVGILAAVGAPSSLAAQLAEEAGMTLLGFVKSSGFNIYSGAERIQY